MQRQESFDILKGIGIILMIVAHTYGPDSKIWDFITAFHMPLFFIVTGYFYKPKVFLVLFKKNFNQLLIPYFVLYIIILIFHQIRNPHDITNDIIVGFNGIGPGWFLLAMFLARIEFNIILKSCPKNYLLVSLFISIGVCFMDYYNNFPPFSELLSFFPSLSSLVFIATGYYIKEHNLLENISRYSIPVIFLSGLFWLLTSIWGKVDLSSCTFKLSIVDFLGSIGGTYVFYRISQYIEKYNNWLKSSLMYAGKYSLVLLFFHSIDYCIPMWHHITPYIDPSFRIFSILTIRLLSIMFCIVITLRSKWLRKLFSI